MCFLSHLDDSLLHPLSLMTQVISSCVDDDVFRVTQVVMTEELEGFVNVRTPKLPHTVTREQLPVFQETAFGVNKNCTFRVLVTKWSLFLCDWLYSDWARGCVC